MSAVDELKAEHALIRTMMGVFSRMCDLMESGEAVDTEHLDQMLDFIVVFVDKYHHRKEEEVFFPRVVALGLREPAVIDAFVYQHDLFKEYISELRADVREKGKGGDWPRHRFIEVARDYISQLTEHSEAEENELFAIAGPSISADKNDKLADEFERLEREEVGAGEHEMYRELASRLTGMFPPRGARDVKET